MSKVCSKCGEEKSLSDFYKNHKSKDGKQHRCKGCSKTFTQDATKSWRLNNPDSNKESERRTKVKLKYGLTLDKVKELYLQQGGTCAICSKPLEFEAVDKRNKPHIDHNHETGIVRGLLCLQCNTGLGMFGDSQELLKLADSYLEFSRQSERLSELAPSMKDDAIVCSHGNNNHERLAEMTNLPKPKI